MMKRFFLVMLLSMVVLVGVTMAAPFDPILPIRPDFPLLPIHPCALANVVVELGDTDYQDLVVANPVFYSAIATHDISVGGDTIGKIVSHYSRVGAGSAARVASDDTIFVDTLRVFGSSSNTTASYQGARGVVKEVLINGVRQDVKATYIIGDFLGKFSLCLTLAP